MVLILTVGLVVVALVGALLIAYYLGKQAGKMEGQLERFSKAMKDTSNYFNGPLFYDDE